MRRWVGAAVLGLGAVDGGGEGCRGVLPLPPPLSRLDPPQPLPPSACHPVQYGSDDEEPQSFAALHKRLAAQRKAEAAAGESACRAAAPPSLHSCIAAHPCVYTLHRATLWMSPVLSQHATATRTLLGPRADGCPPQPQRRRPSLPQHTHPSPCTPALSALRPRCTQPSPHPCPPQTGTSASDEDKDGDGDGDEEGGGADPEAAAKARAEVQRLLEEYYKLDYEDVVGGVPTRFRWARGAWCA